VAEIIIKNFYNSDGESSVQTLSLCGADRSNDLRKLKKNILDQKSRGMIL